MPIKLTESQRALLLDASRREDFCLVLQSNLKGATAQKIATKLIAEGFAKEIKAKVGAPIWHRDSENDQAYSLKLSAAGAKAIATCEAQQGPEAPAQEPLPDSTASPETVRNAAWEAPLRTPPRAYFFILRAPPSNVETIACINPSLVM
jgi:hypothetical protein